MNYKTTVVLLFLVACAAAYFIWFDRGPDSNNKPGAAVVDSTEGTPLFEAKDLSTEAVNKVVVERHGKTVTLEKSGTEWNQTSPVRFAINDWSARQVIDGLASLRASQTLKPDDKSRPALEKLGLAPPEATISLSAGDKRTFTVKLGRTAPGGRAYAMVGDDPAIYVVSDALQRMVTADDYNAWRRTKLTAPTEGQIARVTLARDNGVIQMDKSDGRWTFGGQNQGRVDRVAVQGLATALNELYISKFVEDAPKDLSVYGLYKPTAVVTLVMPSVKSAATSTTKPTSLPTTQPRQGEDKTVTHTLRIGAPTDLSKTAYFATWTSTGEADAGAPGQVVFTIPKSAADRFDKSVDDLRDSRITPVAASDVKKLTIKHADSSGISLVSTPNGWEFGPGSDIKFKADHDAASKLVESITDAKAHAYAPAAQPVGAALGTITLEAQGESEPEQLALFEAPAEKDKPQVVVVRGRETVAYRLDAAALPVLKTTPLALRNKAVLEIAPESIRRVTLTRADEPPYVFEAAAPATTQAQTKAATQAATDVAAVKWSLEGHEKFEAGGFKHLLGQLSSLEAARWLDAAPELGKSPTTAVIEKSDGKSLILRVNSTTGAAVLEGETNGFEIDKALRDALTAEYLDRTVIPMASSDIERITVTNPGAKLAEVTLERDAAGRFVSVEDKPIDQAAAGALFDTVGGLRVERYLAKVSGGDPTTAKIHLTIETKEGKPIALAIPALATDEASIAMTGGLGDRCFRVSAETLKKLTADLSPKVTGQTEYEGMPGMGGIDAE